MSLSAADCKEIKVGSTFNSFAELCRSVGMKPAKGNTRKAQEKELRRFFDWKKAPQVSRNAIVITEIFLREKPRPFRTNDEYSADILNCLIWDARHWTRTKKDNAKSRIPQYTVSALLSLCGFMSEDGLMDSRKSKSLLSEAERHGVLSGTSRADFYHYNRVACHVGDYARGVLDRTLRRLVDFGYLKTCRKTRWVFLEGERREATAEESEKCSELWSEVKEELGITYLSLYNREKLYRRFNELMAERLGFTASYCLWEIEPFDDLDDVSEKQFKDSRLRVNRKSVANVVSWIRESSNKKRAEAEKQFQTISDTELIEIIEMFDISAAEVFCADEETLRENVESELAMVDWFVQLDGAKPYIEMSVKDREAQQGRE